MMKNCYSKTTSLSRGVIENNFDYNVLRYLSIIAFVKKTEFENGKTGKKACSSL